MTDLKVLSIYDEIEKKSNSFVKIHRIINLILFEFEIRKSP